VLRSGLRGTKMRSIFGRAHCDRWVRATREWVPQRELSGGVRGQVCTRAFQAPISYHSILHGFELFLASMQFSVLMVGIIVQVSLGA
jgi:hypothetical protein